MCAFSRALLVAAALAAGACSRTPPAPADLFEAARQGKIDRLESMPARGGKVNAVTEHGQSALLGAAIENHTAVVTWLLGKGADPNLADVHGQTPIYFAVFFKNLEAAEALIKAKANVNAMTKGGEVALTRAILLANVRMTELLIKGGADVNLKSTDPRVPLPLPLARQVQHPEIINLLTQAGAKD